MLNLTIMCKQGDIRGVGLISSHQDQRGVNFTWIVERDDLRMVRGIGLRDLYK